MVLIPARAGGTRWVGHMIRALHNFLDGYQVIWLHLEQLAASTESSESKTKAIGFLKVLGSRDIIAMALFLKDVLDVLHKVSLKFWEEGSVVADVSITIRTAVTWVKSLTSNDGPSLQKLPQFETCQLPSAGTSTRNTHWLTGDVGLHDSDQRNFVPI